MVSSGALKDAKCFRSSGKGSPLPKYLTYLVAGTSWLPFCLVVEVLWLGRSILFGYERDNDEIVVLSGKSQVRTVILCVESESGSDLSSLLRDSLSDSGGSGLGAPSLTTPSSLF